MQKVKSVIEKFISNSFLKKIERMTIIQNNLLNDLSFFREIKGKMV